MKMTKKIIIGALSLTLIGFIMAALGFANGGQLGIAATKSGFKIIGAEQYITLNEALPEFTSIELNSGLHHIEIIPSDQFGIEVKYNEDQDDMSYQVVNGVLKINQAQQNHKLNMMIDLNFMSETSYMKVFVPANTELTSVVVAAPYSDFLMQDIKAQEILLTCNYGDIELNRVDSDRIEIHSNSSDVIMNQINSNEFIVNNEYGDIMINKLNVDNMSFKLNSGGLKLTDIISSNEATISNTYGDMQLSDSEFNQLSTDFNSGNVLVKNSQMKTALIKGRYGDIKMTDVLTNQLDLDADSSDVSLEGTFNGNTKIKMIYGDLMMRANQSKDDSVYTLTTTFGTIKVNGENFGNNVVVTNPNAAHRIEITHQSGDVNFNFEQ